LNNLVEAIIWMVIKHNMCGSEIFIFTDNSTAEAAFWKGTSISKLLFELELRLKELEIDYDLHLHIIHVSGKRMIAEGTNGFSRADHGEGVMLGQDICWYIPLHLNPIEREPKVGSWIADVTCKLNFKVLEPSGWFDDAHKSGNFVWVVPPAAAEVVVEQLGFACLKRPEAMHTIIIVPRLMTGRWQQNLFKVARAGDHLMVPFQCKLCHFCNIPEKWNHTDTKLLDFIRRANLDAFWALRAGLGVGQLEGSHASGADGVPPRDAKHQPSNGSLAVGRYRGDDGGGGHTR
jgi:hypothetical protein